MSKTSVPTAVYYYVPIEPIKPGIGFWLRWVFFTWVGFLASLLFVEIGVRPYIGAVQGAIGGAAIGLAQWLAIRERIPRSQGWILASVLSWMAIGGSSLGALGWIAPRSDFLAVRALHGCLDGILVGALIGLGQWFVLKKYVTRSAWWIVASAASWAIGLPLGWTIGGILHQATRQFLSELIGLALTWLAVSAMTGFSLMGFLRRAYL